MGKCCDWCLAEVDEYYGIGNDGRWSICAKCFERSRGAMSDSDVEKLLAELTALRAKVAAGEALRAEAGAWWFGAVERHDVIREIFAKYDAAVKP